MRAGNAARAEELYRRAVTLDPENAGAWNNLGVCLMERSEGSQAASAFINAANLQPAHAGPYENLGVLYMRTGWAAQARDYFVRALERDPSSSVALRGYAQAVSAVMEPDDADLELLRRGMIAETDPRWRELIQRQVARVEEFQRDRRRGTR
jgi:Flp pilus assembly protein TadD